MPAPPDYYRTLQVPQQATAAEVKQAYRALARRYHPDANPDNAYAPAQFRAVQEAWQVLGHTERRAYYDEELWLSGMQQRVRTHRAITPQWVLHEATRLQRHLAIIDTYRMSHDALAAYLHLLLADAHMAILLRDGTADGNNRIAAALVTAIRLLRYDDAVTVAALLHRLAGDDTATLQAINEGLAQSRYASRRGAWLPWAIVLATLLLAAAMYWYGRC